MPDKSMVFDHWGKSVDKKDFPVISGVPVTFGLTDEIDLTAGFYCFHDARSWKNKSDFTQGYGDSETGMGISRFGAKIRLPFSMDSRIQIAGKFAAVLDTSDGQLDGLNYRWARNETDIESSLYESFDISSFISLHLEQGYVLSGSDVYDDQLVGAAGIEFRIKPWWNFNIEVNNRTFLGRHRQPVQEH